MRRLFAYRPLIAGLLAAAGCSSALCAPTDMPALASAEAVLTRNGKLTFYADAEGARKGGELLVKELELPLAIREELANGLVRIQVKGSDYWVAGEELRIKRPLQDGCITISRHVATAADRGANEGCAKNRGKK